jgi:hypothetical protein
VAKHVRRRCFHLIFPKGRNFVLWALADRALFAVAHAMNCPEGALVIHVYFEGTEEGSQLLHAKMHSFYLE